MAPRAEKREWSWQEQEGPLKRSCLYEEHRKLTRHLVPFAGWEMPVRYTSVSEEHRATAATQRDRFSGVPEQRSGRFRHAMSSTFQR